MSIVYVTSIVLAAVFVFVAVFSVALYKIVMQCSLMVNTMEYTTCPR